jgi:hypothetical protein
MITANRLNKGMQRWPASAPTEEIVAVERVESTGAIVAGAILCSSVKQRDAPERTTYPAPPWMRCAEARPSVP